MIESDRESVSSWTRSTKSGHQVSAPPLSRNNGSCCSPVLKVWKSRPDSGRGSQVMAAGLVGSTDFHSFERGAARAAGPGSDATTSVQACPCGVKVREWLRVSESEGESESLSE